MADDFNNDDFSEENTIRRQQRKKREAEKRRQERERMLREAQEELALEAADMPGSLRRKRTDLKKLIKQLKLKAMLKEVIENSSSECWGPEVAIEKTDNCIGVFLNYLHNTGEDGEQQPAANVRSATGHFGIWLFDNAASPQEELHIAIGTKVSYPDGEWDPARPPDTDSIVTSLIYSPNSHEDIIKQIRAALQSWRE